MAQVVYNLLTIIFFNLDVNDPRQRDHECHNIFIQGASGDDTEYEYLWGFRAPPSFWLGPVGEESIEQTLRGFTIFQILSRFYYTWSLSSCALGAGDYTWGNSGQFSIVSPCCKFLKVASCVTEKNLSQEQTRKDCTWTHWRDCKWWRIAWDRGHGCQILKKKSGEFRGEWSLQYIIWGITRFVISKCFINVVWIL